MSSTRSGSFPPQVAAKVHSVSHMWVRQHLDKLHKPLRVTYRPVGAEDMAEVVSLHKEWFPINYKDSYFQSVNSFRECVAAVIDPADYGDAECPQPIIVGLIIFGLQENPDNSYLRMTYVFSTTYTVYITTLGVIEELRGFGIAKELINQCICQAQASPYQPVFVSLHVATYNDEAIPFYERLGFLRVETMRNHYEIRGRPYDAFFYICYTNGAKGPWLTYENVTAALRGVLRVPGFFKAMLRFS